MFHYVDIFLNHSLVDGYWSFCLLTECSSADFLLQKWLLPGHAADASLVISSCSFLTAWPRLNHFPSLSLSYCTQNMRTSSCSYSQSNLGHSLNYGIKSDFSSEWLWRAHSPGEHLPPVPSSKLEGQHRRRGACTRCAQDHTIQHPSKIGEGHTRSCSQVRSCRQLTVAEGRVLVSFRDMASLV